jgi:hypothetical protein
MAKKIIVLPGCMACGLCTVSSYIEEKPDGTVVPKGGVVLQDEEVSVFQQFVNECPARVLQLETVTSKTKQAIIAQMEQEAETFAFPIPTKESVSFEKEKIKIEVPSIVYGEYHYDYSSYNRAKEAAKQAIDSAFYSQRKTAVQNVINRYQIEKLSPYYDYKETADNFYYSANQKAQKKLDQWVQEILLYKPGITISEQLLKIQTRPDSTLKYYLSFIKTDILSFAGSILAELSDSVYSLSSYVDYCDIDSEEVYAGEGMFGRTKYVTKYCFSNTSEAFREMKKDLEGECRSSFDEKIVTQAYSVVKVLAEQYSKNLKEELKGKIGELKKLL